MRENRTIRTDTATLVLFDPEVLAYREADESDWWTGDEDLAQEETNQGLAFINTGTDGAFEVAVTDEVASEVSLPIKASSIRVPSGRLLFGAGEFLPGDGPSIARSLEAVAVDPGVYCVQVFLVPPGEDGLPAYRFVLAKERVA